MKRTALLSLAVLLALWAAGCSAGKPAATAPAVSADAQQSVTAFGAVRCAEAFTLTLPVEARVTEVFAREGQSMPPHSNVLRIDMEKLRAEKARAGHETAALETAIEECQAEIRQAEANLNAAENAAGKMDVEKLADILHRLANAGTRVKRDAAERELLDGLKAIGSVGRYHDLVALTADRRRARGNARPALLALQEQLNEACRARAADLAALRQKLEESEALVLPLREKTDIMEKILGGEPICGVGCFGSDGVLTTQARPLMPSALPGYAGQVFAPGAAVAAFSALDTLEVVVNVEEQLIAGVAVGAEAQLSPLYDRGVVWLGTVSAVSSRAVEVNGETVVPVTVKCEDLTLGPGYNVTVKIRLLKK